MNLFQLGAVIFSVFTFLGILLNKIGGQYSVLYYELSHTGIRSTFVHPKTGIKYSRSITPGFFTIAMIGSGLVWLVAFLQKLETSPLLSYMGIVFAISVVSVGYFDVSQYEIHMLAVSLSQTAFLSIIAYISFEYGSVKIYSLIALIIFFLIYYAVMRSKNHKSSSSDHPVISQKIYIYLEIIFIFFLPNWSS